MPIIEEKKSYGSGIQEGKFFMNYSPPYFVNVSLCGTFLSPGDVDHPLLGPRHLLQGLQGQREISTMQRLSDVKEKM